jgi:hypothetical protein
MWILRGILITNMARHIRQIISQQYSAKRSFPKLTKPQKCTKKTLGIFSSQRISKIAPIAAVVYLYAQRTLCGEQGRQMDSPLVAKDAKRKSEKENDMVFNKDKDEQIFLRGVTKLTPEDFIALSKVLDVKMSVVDKDTGEYTLRDAEDVLNDMVYEFRKLKHKERKIVLKAVSNSGPRS